MTGSFRGVGGAVGALRRGLDAWRRRRADAAAARRNRDSGTHCFYCGAAFEEGGELARTVDHRVPRGRGGHDGLVNLVFSCHACNQRKADKPEAQFVSSEWLQQRRRERDPEPPPQL
jgi:5-methylcytosine-specific restriction endonuclease McrA